MRPYKHIDDLPLYNYVKIKKTNDLKWLLIAENYDSLNIDPVKDKLTDIWKEIQFQLMELNGVPDEQQIIINRQREMLLLNIELMTEDNADLINILRIKQRELNEIMDLMNKRKTYTLDELIAHVDKHFGQIDLHKTSVTRFFTYLKIMQDAKPNKEN